MKQSIQHAKEMVLAVLGPFLGQNMPIFAGCATLFLLTASFPLLIWALVTDCLDYSEWKLNIRSDGSMYSLYTFSRKIGSTIASTGAASALAAIGYVSGTNVVQTAATVNNIYYLVNIVPVITCVLELIGIGLIFNLDKKTTNQMYAELAARRAQAAETQE